MREEFPSIEIESISVRFSESTDETNASKKISDYFNTNHHVLEIDNFLEELPKAISIVKQPFWDLHWYYLVKKMKNFSNVFLSGDGGDELFCGYNRYKLTENRSKKFNMIPSILRKILAKGIKSIPQNDWYSLFNVLPGLDKNNNFGYKMHKGANALEAKNLTDMYYTLFSHWQNPTEAVLNSNEPSTLLTTLMPKLKGLNSQQKMMALDLLTYLPDDILVKVDRAAMASSLETRVPLLDHKLIEYVWKIPHSLKLRNGDGKWILKQVLNKYVPKYLTDRPKMGFAIPLHSWLRGPLRDWAENLLNEKRLMQEGYFNPELIREKWDQHICNKKNWQHDLWNVLMFQAWIDVNN